jgi:hypothetical protein
MSSVIISGDTSGAVTIAAPAVAGTNTLTLQAGTATNSMNTLATSVATTSGTSIDFTAIPSWVKRITVMLSGVSVSGTSNLLLRIGAGSVEITGYVSSAQTNTTISGSTTGYILTGINSAAENYQGLVTLSYFGSNTWISGSTMGRNDGVACSYSGGTKTLSGTLDRVRLTTVNGTDTFDAGSVNILYEG